MATLKSLLKTRRKIGLAFARNGGITLEVRSCADNRLCWQKSIPSANPESDDTTVHLDAPKVAGWLLVIPAYQCTARYAVLPSADPVEIESMIEFELPSIVPYNTVSWVWDFSIIGRQEDGASKAMIVISPSSVVERHIETLQAVGIRPDVVTTSAAFFKLLLSTRKVLPESVSSGCFCFDHDSIDFLVAQNGWITYFRSSRLSDTSPQDTECTEREVQRALSILKEQKDTPYPAAFFAVSTDRSAAGAGKIVEKVLGNSVEEVDLDGSCDGHSCAMEMLAAASVDTRAARNTDKALLNLLPRHLKERRQQRMKRRQMAGHAVKLCFIVFLMFLCLKVSICRNNGLLDSYEHRLSVISPMAEKIQGLQEQLSIIQSQLQANVSTLEVICELYRALPKDVTVHYLSIERDNRVVIRAQAKLLSQAFDCIGPLEQSKYFSNVRQSYANQSQIEDSVLIDFEITADLQKTQHSGMEDERLAAYLSAQL